MTQREKLTEALRNEFANRETEPLDDFARGIAAAIQRRGITSVPGATRPEKPWRRHVIDTLLDDKAKTEQAQAQREAEQSAPPPAPTTAELVKRALQVEVEKLNAAEETGSDPSSTPALNSSALLSAALGHGNRGTINGTQW